VVLEAGNREEKRREEKRREGKRKRTRTRTRTRRKGIRFSSFFCRVIRESVIALSDWT
jgi:hypothetical protein